MLHNVVYPEAAPEELFQCLDYVVECDDWNSGLTEDSLESFCVEFFVIKSYLHKRSDTLKIW